MLRAPLLRRDRRQVGLTAAGAALHAMARDLLADWDDTVAAVADAASAEARVLRVGTQTSLGRALYPAVLDLFAKQQPDWRVELQAVGWDDPTAGLADHTCDVSFLWLPTGSADLEARVLATEPRSVALSSHPPAGRPGRG